MSKERNENPEEKDTNTKKPSNKLQWLVQLHTDGMSVLEIVRHTGLHSLNIRHNLRKAGYDLPPLTTGRVKAEVQDLTSEKKATILNLFYGKGIGVESIAKLVEGTTIVQVREYIKETDKTFLNFPTEVIQRIEFLRENGIKYKEIAEIITNETHEKVIPKQIKRLVRKIKKG